MTAVTAAHVRTAAKTRVNESNLNSVMIGLQKYENFALDLLHRAVPFVGQLLHESGSFRYEKSNAAFKDLSARHRCLVFMRDSGLPASACD